jgi:hypothetical protein
VLALVVYPALEAFGWRVRPEFLNERRKFLGEIFNCDFFVVKLVQGRLNSLEGRQVGEVGVAEWCAMDVV